MKGLKVGGWGDDVKLGQIWFLYVFSVLLAWNDSLNLFHPYRFTDCNLVNQLLLYWLVIILANMCEFWTFCRCFYEHMWRLLPNVCTLIFVNLSAMPESLICFVQLNDSVDLTLSIKVISKTVLTVSILTLSYHTLYKLCKYIKSIVMLGGIFAYQSSSICTDMIPIIKFHRKSRWKQCHASSILAEDESTISQMTLENATSTC